MKFPSRYFPAFTLSIVFNNESLFSFTFIAYILSNKVRDIIQESSLVQYPLLTITPKSHNVDGGCRTHVHWL